MSSTNRKWQVAPPIQPGVLQAFCEAGFDPLLAQLLYNRGNASPAEASAFLEPQESGDPFLLPDMSTAVTRLRTAIRKGESIVVYGDYDADGVTATALLVDVLASLGARVSPYIPHRVDEGYGLHTEALQELAQNGCGLIVTVDCGIRSIPEAEWARDHSLDMIITDHHSAGETLPPAVACVDPKRSDSRYPYGDLSGVGVAFRVAQALLRSHQQVPVLPGVEPIPESDLLDLVALGTVADLAPLTGENRALVQSGVGAIRRTQRPGLRELIASSNLQGPVSVGHIGFILGPRLNAAGRLSTAMDSYHLLTTRSVEQARELAQKLNDSNRRRQLLTAEAVEKARSIALEGGEPAYLIFVADKDILGGIAGLVASKLTEEFYRPSVVVQIADGVSRGSARSIPEWNVTAALDRCRALLVRHGGHAAAAGFEVENRLLPILQEELQRLASQELDGRDLAPTLPIDAEVSLGQMTWETYRAISRLEPHGYGNPSPVLVCRGALVKDSRIVAEKHLKLMLSDGRAVWDAIAFRMADRAAGLPHKVDVAFSLEVNSWNGQERLQLNVKDINASQE